ncbi:hypothetical protein ADK57_32170 [Streptomyces sp. MMG1533]|uniref:DUF6085 family protein n=1 Tax=Streptomyces sp. MMG1533 TaxID=1415546 RepID=UPI0006AE166E|nr:DUF6085 family protein [Streptomyces sp. MMG1533]KOU59922.1 hypothetical protein ADK57_32170 [Streptomyces sp. MMG1533]
MTDNPTARLLDCGLCFEEQGEEVHPHPECPIATVARYHRRADEVQAVQWTGHNADTLRAFAGHHFDTIDPEDRIEDGDQDAQVLIEASYWTGISPGYWVLKFEDHLDVERDENFRAGWAPAAVPVVSAAVPPTTQTAEPVCVCGHPMRLHHEDVCLLTGCGCNDGREPEAADLADRLEAVLTEKFTELGNPFSRMRIAFQGPDGWPASKEVGPHDVALVLRELLADEAPPLPSIHANDVAGFCPACGHGVLMLGSGGHVTCTLMDCPKPEAADELLHRADEAQQQPETQDRSAGCCGRPPGAICVHDHPAAASVGVQTDEEAENPRTVCVCGHTKGEHLRVSGRLLCDACDPDSTENLTCTGFDAL